MTKAELEARRSELAENLSVRVASQGLRECFRHGFDSCAALLQSEMDAEKERYELALASSIRYGNKVFDLESQLQSANAKLAVARKALDKLAGPGDCGCMGRPCECLSETVLLIDRRERIGLAREALAQIAALDASEGKGKE